MDLQSDVEVTFLYALVDPFTGEIRYVGKSNRPKKRYTAHLRDKSKTHKANWIRSLLGFGAKPILKILKRVEYSQWQDKEKQYIKMFSNLTNFTEGGEGGITFKINPMLGKTHTKEARIKISMAHKGKKISEEQKRIVSKKLIGKMVGEKNPWAKRYKVVYTNGRVKFYMGCTKEAYRKEHLSKTTFYEFVRGERKNYGKIKSISYLGRVKCLKN